MNKILLNASLLLLGVEASAAVFNVNVLTDGVDTQPGDGICEVSAGIGDCSLRAAINEANSTAEADTINLGPGVHQLSITGIDTQGLVGDLNIKDYPLTITGMGAGITIIDGNDTGRVMSVWQPGEFTMEQLTITGGLADDAGEAVGAGLSVGGVGSVVTLRQLEIINNVANAGAGLNINHVDVLIEDSLIANNENINFGFANVKGAGIATHQVNMTIRNTAIINNNGGDQAVYLRTAHLDATNMTISGNSGGAIETSNATAVITFSTIYSPSNRGIRHYSFDDSHVLAIGNSILSTGQTNTLGNCQSGDKPTSLGYNLVNDSSCDFLGTGDVQDASILLQPLSIGTGLWPTHGLPMGSPAVDHVPMADCLDHEGVAMTRDQRALNRPSGIACDAGAHEFDQDIVFFDTFDDLM
jgi:CSLREA domain-containing protein